MPFDVTEANNFLKFEFGIINKMDAHSKVYMGLSSNDPEADGGTFNELSGGGYSRVLINQYGQEYPALMGNPASRVIANIKQINWNKATAELEAKGIGLFTEEKGGTPFFYGKLTGEDKVTVGVGAVALFEAGNFKLGLSGKDEEIE